MGVCAASRAGAREAPGYDPQATLRCVPERALPRLTERMRSHTLPGVVLCCVWPRGARHTALPVTAGRRSVHALACWLPQAFAQPLVSSPARPRYPTDACACTALQGPCPSGRRARALRAATLAAPPLAEWLREHGAADQPVELREMDVDGSTLDVTVATEDIASGEPVLRIPDNLIVTLDRVFEDETVAEVLTTDKLSELACLTLYLMCGPHSALATLVAVVPPPPSASW